ncbi:MAG: hypothetical protein LBE21_04995 [Pseudomonadales bacterium]|jgi:hypothetical protein|nr:hypothetical protein [Pseudomonadales bacterium]
MPIQQFILTRTPTLTLISALFLSLCAGALRAQPVIIDSNGSVARLSNIDELFIQEHLNAYDFNTLCASSGKAREVPRNDFRKLTFPREDRHITLLVPPDVLRSDFVLFYTPELDGENFDTYSRCRSVDILPVLALVATAVIDDNIASISTRQEVMAQHSFLTSYEANRLMARYDSNEISGAYMDFTLSVKNPLFQNSSVLNSFYQGIANGVDALTQRENGLYIQPYLAFSGRFSQYISNRESAPVLARRFNPSLFMRAWSSNNSYLDLGFAHESNGQSIDNQANFDREILSYLESGATQEEAFAFARDEISRGWDYSFLAWRKAWHQRFATRLQLRHYHHGGPLQGGAEEYNPWEGDGEQLRPRRQYDGVLLGLEYDFTRSRCLEGFSFICFQKLSLTQETGYSRMFENNTTTLEFTSNFFGLPIQLWGRSGYVGNLVDYYDYSTSWGLGFELLSH